MPTWRLSGGDAWRAGELDQRGGAGIDSRENDGRSLANGMMDAAAGEGWRTDLVLPAHGAEEEKRAGRCGPEE